MISRIFTSALLLSIVAAQETAQIDPKLVGTWTTKSRTVFTGPGFYNPVDDRLIEPKLAGISYSFTADGHYEEAYYRATANPTNPECPKGAMQWQHGTFVQNANNSLTLTPIKVDGRQLVSDPCAWKNAMYTRYHQSELFKRFEIITDPYHGVPRLNLYSFDGSPMNPMYLAYSPTPQMLPTMTLNPTTSATGSSQPSETGASKQKRSEVDAFYPPLNARTMAEKRSLMQDPDTWWWFGVGATVLGSVAYFAF